MARRGRGEGTIYQRSDGRWEGQVDLGYVNGRRVRKSVYGRTRREVQEKIRRLLEERARGLPVVDERTTLGAFLEQWLESVTLRVRPKTARFYRQIVSTYLIPELGRQRLAQLQPQHVEAALAQLRRRDLAPRTVAHCRAVLRTALNDAVRWGILPRNPAALASVPKVERPELSVWDMDEIRAFLETAREHRLYPLFVLTLALGLRQGEVLGLSWEDVDLERRIVTVRAQLQFVDGRWERVPPKSRQRVLPLSAACVEALERQRAQQREEERQAGELWRGNPWRLVFTSEVGTPLHARNVVRVFSQLCERAGVPRIRFHDLRHTCATYLLRSGVPARVVQEILGHSEIRVTLDTYTHVLPDMLESVTDTIDRALRG